MSIYEGILKTNTEGTEGEEPLDQDEITDITTNYLACQASVQKSSQEEVQNFLQQYWTGTDRWQPSTLPTVHSLKDACDRFSRRWRRTRH